MKFKILIAGVLFSMTQSLMAAQVKLVCPCDVDALGLTGISITAGVSNPDSSAAGKVRYRVIGYEPASGLEGFRQDSFFTMATYELVDSLAAGASISSATIKTGLTIPGAPLTMALLLEELVGTTWTRRDFARLTPAVTLADGGESAFSNTEERSSAIYLDGLATLSSFGGQATIQLPAIGNSSRTFATGTLEIDVLQTTSPTALSFSGATFAVNPVTISSNLPARSLLIAQTVTAAFSDESSGNFFHLRVKDSVGTLAYQTVLNTSGALPTRSLDTTNIRVLDDTDGDGVKDYSETLVGTNPSDSASKPTSNIIDTLVIYTQGVPALYGGDPSARIDQLIALSNQVYQSSGLELTLRLASSAQKTVDETATLNTLLSAMDARSGSFSDLDTLKANANADIVILMVPDNPSSDLCGLANLGGFGSGGDFLSENNRKNANGTVYINCGDDTTTVHEVGHILGLGHSRKQDPIDGGTFDWAVGYGVDANFVTVMAYGSEFAGASTILKHSSPSDINCNNLPCGIAKTDAANGADAVDALRVSQYQVAKYYASASSSTDTDGDGTPDATDSDDDNDGVPDVSDAFPTNSAEFADTDGDGTGNNADTDDDGDGVLDTADAFPLDNSETTDSDGDGVGDNADTNTALRLDPNKTIELSVIGAALSSPSGSSLTVPSTASAVSINVTVVSPDSAGFITVYPCGVTRPLASNVNYTAGQVVPNGVIAAIGSNGKVCFYSSSTTDIIVDVAGWFTGESFVGATPKRLVDSRDGTGTSAVAKLTSASPLAVQITSLAVTTAAGSSTTIPTNISAAALNVTVVNPESAGFITVYPCDVTRPNASNVNYVTGQTVANGVVAPVSSDGRVCLYSSVPTDIIVDLAGWLGGSSFTGATPKRLVDTRDGTGGLSRQLTNTDELSVPIRSIDLTVSGSNQAVPSGATAAALNVTVVSPTAPGFVTVYPCGVTRPLSSNLNYVAGDVVANNVVAPISTNGNVCVYTSSNTDIIVDVAGYFSGDSSNGFVGSTPKRLVDTRDGTGPSPK